MISCVLLSAGLSSRFGSPKPLALVQKEPIIVRTQNMLISSQIGEIIIVLGAHVDEIKPLILNHKRIRAVYNKDYNFGQTSSFQAGINEASPDSQGFMLLPVDYPLIESLTIDRLIEEFLKSSPSILVPTYDGIKGHPPVFSSALKEEILNLQRDKGINSIIHRHDQDTKFLEVTDSSVLKTFNTIEELNEL